ncbi:hypothetical protein ColLi_13268 [Colletotrichum liriopes]|uniref:Uncharacterized protein n=1 Tax=Colletotrichum liriopes TaxID=708192 RepID=A0AA37LYJ6_9PEZI|nr:hypothetical protein ColLi_13268 [Colletotrichum liriopes]
MSLRIDRRLRARQLGRFLDRGVGEDKMEIERRVQEADPGHKLLQALGWQDEEAHANEEQWLAAWNSRGQVKTWIKGNLQKWRQELDKQEDESTKDEEQLAAGLKTSHHTVGAVERGEFQVHGHVDGGGSNPGSETVQGEKQTATAVTAGQHHLGGGLDNSECRRQDGQGGHGDKAASMPSHAGAEQLASSTSMTNKARVNMGHDSLLASAMAPVAPTREELSLLAAQSEAHSLTRGGDGLPSEGNHTAVRAMSGAPSQTRASLSQVPHEVDTARWGHQHILAMPGAWDAGTGSFGLEGPAPSAHHQHRVTAAAAIASATAIPAMAGSVTARPGTAASDREKCETTALTMTPAARQRWLDWYRGVFRPQLKRQI